MIPQYEPSFDNTVLSREMSQYLSCGGWITEHTKTRDFEDKLGSFLGMPCSVVSNGTISLCLALMALGVRPGDEVLVPDLTMVATANAVSFIGAIPVFVDVNRLSLCMSYSDCIKKYTPKTKAVIYVTLNGRCGMDYYAIKNFASNNKIALIEDDAQSLGSKYPTGEYVGQLADMASYSFSVPKIITTGQGGCLASNKLDAIRKLRDFGRTSADEYIEFGINAKFTDIQAIVGIEQLRNINERIARKKEIYKEYYCQLKDCVEFIPTDLNVTAPWFVDIYLENRDGLMCYLKKFDIGVRPMYPAISSLPFCQKEPCQVALKYSHLGVWLPSSMTISDDQIIFVCDKIREFIKENGYV